jgi:RNA polymerase sigma factor (sigma-70 family)
MSIRKKDWTLTKEAFDKLLALFDPDPNRAADHYELIRSQIIKFFECRGVFTSRDLTDETFNRVARKIIEGGEIYANSLSSYFYGVARNVLREHLRNPETTTSSLETLAPYEHPAEISSEVKQRRLERQRFEQRLECLETCVQALPPATRRLILSYYEGEEGVKIENRKRLAESLKTTLGALRIRAHRSREKLEKCVIACLERSRGE